MASIVIGIYDYNIVYVDATATGLGDGSSPANAITTLPAASTMPNWTFYLCRRSDTSIYTWSASTSSLSNSNYFIIGMPKQNEVFYSQIPAEAKAAWDGDNYEYCRIRYSSYNTTVAFNNLSNFGLHRIWLETPRSSSTTGSARLALNGNYVGNFFMTNCKTSIQSSLMISGGIPISGALYNGSSSDNRNFTVYSHGFRDTIIESNEFDCWGHDTYYSSYWSSPTTGPIYFHSSTTNISTSILFNNNRIAMAPIYSAYQVNTTYSQPAVHIRGTRTTYVECCNNHFTYVGNAVSTSNYFGDALTINGCLPHIDSLKFDTFFNINPYPMTRKLSGCFSVGRDEVCANSKIKNITADMYDIQSSIAPAIYIRNTNEYPGYVENITISGSNPDSYVSPGVNGIYINGGNGFTNQNFDAKNLRIYTHPAGSSSFHHSRSVTDAIIHGKIDTSMMSLCEIDYLKYTGTPTVVTNVANNKLTHIKEVYISTAGWGNQVWLNSDGTAGWNFNDIIVDKLTLNPEGLVTVDPSRDHHGVWINNSNNLPGYFYAYNGTHYIKSSNVYRLGGANSSLRFVATNNSRYAIWICPPNLRGLEKVYDNVSYPYYGKATIYLAFKGFTDATQLSKYLYFEIECPYINTIKKFNSYINGAYSEDNSTWYNDYGLTLRKLEIFFTVFDERPITLRGRYDWYYAGAYLYMDPKVIFE